MERAAHDQIWDLGRLLRRVSSGAWRALDRARLLVGAAPPWLPGPLTELIRRAGQALALLRDAVLRSLRLLAPFALAVLLMLGPGCGVRATFERLDEDHDGVMLGEDCASNDATTGSVPIYADKDEDGHGVLPQIGVGCDGDEGVSVVADDCDDTNIHIWEYSTWFLDNDRDGYGVEPGVDLCASEAAGYALVAGDCLDDDPGAWPGAPTSCDGDDNDCDGQTDEDCEVPSGTLSASDADWLAQGSDDAQLGAALSPAGDVDCDGLDDVLIGAPGADGGDGAVVLAYGSDEALRWTLGEESARVAVLTGEGGGFGSAVAGNVDFDGDGCADLVIGVPWEEEDGLVVHALGPGGGWGDSTPDGSVFVVTGPWIPGDATVTDLMNIGVLSGEDGGQLGTSLACGGDYYGDGGADCLLGSPYQAADDGSEQAGAVAVINPPLLSGEAHELADLVVEGSTKGERLGSALTSGDLDGDGVADLVLGATTDIDAFPEAELHPNRIGRAYVVLGVPGGSYSSEGLADTWVEGVARDGTGAAVASGADLDGDGTDDILVGAPDFTSDAGTVGSVAIYSGSLLAAADGPLTTADASAVLEGTTEGDQLGTSVGLVPDMTSDERAEILVGAPGYDEERGVALLFLDALSGRQTPEAASLRVEGDGGDDRVGQTLGRADVNGLGLNDLLVGGAMSTSLGATFTGSGTSLVVFTDAF